MASTDSAVPQEENTSRLTLFLINEASFRQLYLAHWQKLYNICFNQIPNRELAKEMVQDIFKSVWERRDCLRIEQSIEFYLVRSAKLKVCEYFRNSAVANKHQALVDADYCDADHCTEQQIAYRDLSEQVGLLVDTLSCQCRKVYQLSQEQGLSHKEVASALLISEKAVEYHLHKAKTLLRARLAVYRD